MRIDSNQKKFIFNYCQNFDCNNLVYLFGSRTDDNAKGGDIDLMIISEKKINHFDLYKMKLAFCEQFGNQKIDIVNLTHDNKSAFKQHLLSYAQIIDNE